MQPDVATPPWRHLGSAAMRSALAAAQCGWGWRSTTALLGCAAALPLSRSFPRLQLQAAPGFKVLLGLRLAERSSLQYEALECAAGVA